MKLTPLKLAMCFSLLIHGSALSAYYAFQHASHSERVKFNHERASEIEIVSEPVQNAADIPAPVLVKAVDVPKSLPQSTPPPQRLETKQPALVDLTVLPPANSAEVAPQTQRETKEPEAATDPQPVEVATAGNPAAEMDGGIPANYLFNPKPVYPFEARKRKESGSVVLAVQVNREGFPDRIKIVQSSHFPLLDESAVKAVNQWRFTPTRLGNTAVASQIEVPICFKLLDSK